MRTFLTVLLVIATLGIGLSILIAFSKAFGATQSTGEALVLAVWPFLIGTVAMTGVAIMLAIEDQTTRLERLLAKRGE